MVGIGNQNLSRNKSPALPYLDVLYYQEQGMGPKRIREELTNTYHYTWSLSCISRAINNGYYRISPPPYFCYDYWNDQGHPPWKEVAEMVYQVCHVRFTPTACAKAAQKYLKFQRGEYDAD